MFSSHSLTVKCKLSQNLTGNVSGFTLIEMMVSLSLGIFLLLGITKLYLSVQDIFRYTNELASFQNRVQAASHILNSVIRSAGYVGCSSRSIRIRTSNLVQGSANTNEIEAIKGYSSAQAMAMFGLPSHGLGAVKNNSDSILIQKASDNVSSIINTEGQYLTITENDTLKSGDELVISDCKNAQLARINQVTPQGKLQHVLMNNIIGHYDNNAIASPFVSYIFYVGNTGRHNTAGLPIYALYLQEKCGAKKETNELIEGVDDLQVKYHVHVDNENPKHYKSASQIKEWGRVSSVKLLLTLNSMETIEKEMRTVVGNNNENNKMDKPLEIVIALRNRLE